MRQQWGTEMNCRLARASIKIFEQLEEMLDYPRSIEFKQEGYLILAFTPAEARQFEANVRLQRSLGVPVTLMDARGAKEIVPHLVVDRVVAATFCPEDGHINPFLATDAYARAARRRGVDIRLWTEVTGILVNNGRVKGVHTNRGFIHCPVVVNAAGPYSQLVAAMAGVDIPVYSERHQILVTEPVQPMQGPMVISFHHGFYCQQTPHGSFIMGVGDPHEPKDFDVGHSWQFLEQVCARVRELLPGLLKLHLVRQWSGLYNITPDAQPILGGVPGLEGYWMAVGFSGHGFMLAPITGKIMAQLILGEQPEIDVSMLGLDRFERGELIREPSVV